VNLKGATPMKTTKEARAALYARVSTATHGQDPEVQLQPLRQVAAQRGWRVIEEYVDIGISGGKESRPELDRLMKAVRSGQVDMVAVARFDRFARSTKHLLDALDEMRRCGVDFISLTESVDTGTAIGKMVFTFLAAVAEFERALIQERVLAGVAKAKAEGTHCGRPRRNFDLRPVLVLLEQGNSVREVSRMVGIPRGTIRRRLKELEQGRQVGGQEVPMKNSRNS